MSSETAESESSDFIYDAAVPSFKEMRKLKKSLKQKTLIDFFFLQGEFPEGGEGAGGEEEADSDQ